MTDDRDDLAISTLNPVSPALTHTHTRTHHTHTDIHTDHIHAHTGTPMCTHTHTHTHTCNLHTHMHVQITHTYTHVCTLSLQTCPAVSFSTGDSPCLGGDDTITCRCFFTLESSNISTDLLPLGFSDDDDNAGDDDDLSLIHI